MSRTVGPICTFVLSRRSILDTLFASQLPRRPAYATTTDGSVTTLWRIDPHGNLSEVAQIHWQSDGAKSSVVINGQVMFVDNVLQRSKSFFGSDSRTFVAGNMRCKWKSGKGGYDSSVHIDSKHLSNTAGAVYTSSQVWKCYETTNYSGLSPDVVSSSSTVATPLVALFFPPQSGLVKSEITIYPNGELIIDHIILTALLVGVRKDEWRSAQSAVTRNALEASIKAEIRGTLPPYIPTTAARYRVPSSPQLRRPHSAGVARSRYSSSQAPPPYSSAGDPSLHSR